MKGQHALVDEQPPRIYLLTSTPLEFDKRLLEQGVHIFKCITLFHKLLGLWKLFRESVDAT